MSFHKRDSFSRLKRPGVAYAYFVEAKLHGIVPSNRSWAQHNAAYRKKLRKKRLAKLSRRRNRPC